MLTKIVKQCAYCRSIIYIEKPSEVSDKIIDARRVISVKCGVCGAELEVKRTFMRRDDGGKKVEIEEE